MKGVLKPLMRFSNMHQHSVFSDGASTMEDIVQAAIRKNFVSLGFAIPFAIHLLRKLKKNS